MTGSEGARPSGSNRRTVVKGAAWAVPAVAVAAAAPALAASPKCLTAQFLGDSCKQPGSGNNFGYRLEICFTNTCATSITLDVTQVAANTGNPVVLAVSQDPITIPAGGQACLPQDVLYCSNSSANFINVTFTVAGQPGTQVISVPSPVQTCRAEDQFC